MCEVKRIINTAPDNMTFFRVTPAKKISASLALEAFHRAVAAYPQTTSNSSELAEVLRWHSTSNMPSSLVDALKIQGTSFPRRSAKVIRVPGACFPRAIVASRLAAFMLCGDFTKRACIVPAVRNVGQFVLDPRTKDEPVISCVSIGFVLPQYEQTAKKIANQFCTQLEEAPTSDLTT